MSLHRGALVNRAFVSAFVSMLPVLLVAGSGPVTLRSARAQGGPNEDLLAKMKELNRQAIADYAAEDYESAQLGLREAIAVGQRAGMRSEPLLARLFANLGAVYISGLKDQRRGIRALESALAIEPGVKLTDTLITPELREVFARLQSRVLRTEPGSGPPPAAAGPSPETAPALPPARPVEGAAAGPPPSVLAVGRAPQPPRPGVGGEEPDLPARVPQPLFCPTPDEAPPSERITLHCVLQPEVSASKVLLYYRGTGARGFTSASTVRSDKGWYRGVIPGDVVHGRSLYFYFEARGAGDEVVGRAGRDDSPNVVLIRAGAQAVGPGLYAGVGYESQASSPEVSATEEDPLETFARERERRQMAGVRRRRVGAPYLGLGLGWGYGYHRTQRLEFYSDAIIEKGWIPSGLLHLTPEIGYQWSESFALSVLARLQLISQQGSGALNDGHPARSAHVILARPQLLLGPGNLRFNLSGYVGAGNGFRLTIAPQPPRFQRNDSVRGGPWVAGGGLGLLFHISSHVSAALDGRWLLGYPALATVADVGLTLQIGL